VSLSQRPVSDLPCIVTCGGRLLLQSIYLACPSAKYILYGNISLIKIRIPDFARKSGKRILL
jgi:hypothetical protein